MSVDFGGNVLVKAKKESLKSLKNIDDIIYVEDCWSDNKCGPSTGYYRKSFIFGIKDYMVCYIVNNSIFSGFVNSERILVVDKKTNEKVNYKLEKQDSNEIISFSSIFEKSYTLNETDYEYIEDFSFECDFDEGSSGDDQIVKKHIPQVHIVKDDANYVFVNATINKVESYIIFKFDQDRLINVIHFNRESLKAEIMSVRELNDEEYIDALMNANIQLSCDKEIKNFTFDKAIQFKLCDVGIRLDKTKADNDQFDSVKQFCEEAILPYIPKLNIAELKDNVLTMPNEFPVISNYLVKYILHSLRITSDTDLNNYNYCDECLEGLKLKLVIPGNVQVIGEQAFMNKQFKSIVIEEGVETIGAYAFYNCTANEIKLPSTITSISSNAFAENSIQEIHLSSKLKYIDGDVFTRCNHLAKIYIENNENYKTNDYNNVLIENKEDKLIIALKEANIPDGIKIIGMGCFSWLSDEGELVIPNGVEKIEDNAFSTCDFTNIIFPETIVEIGNRAFWQCNNLTCIVFPKSLRKIGESSFTYCRNLTEVHFNSMVEVGRYCFSDSTKLFDENGSLINKNNNSNNDLTF